MEIHLHPTETHSILTDGYLVPFPLVQSKAVELLHSLTDCFERKDGKGMQ